MLVGKQAFEQKMLKRKNGASLAIFINI
jgi:hypothetical protein